VLTQHLAQEQELPVCVRQHDLSEECREELGGQWHNNNDDDTNNNNNNNNKNNNNNNNYYYF
jgi:hypothetical protein